MEAFDIFLSHNSADKDQVECIARKLLADGLKPWLDKWYLVAGQIWQYELATVLRSCATFGIFVGRNGLGDWAREELLVAQDRAAKERSFRLIPILLPGVPIRSTMRSCLPFSHNRRGLISAVVSASRCRSANLSTLSKAWRAVLKLSLCRVIRTALIAVSTRLRKITLIFSLAANGTFSAF